MDILLIFAGGIGNTILFGPTLRRLRDACPRARIDAYVYRSAFADPFRESGLIDQFHVHDSVFTAFDLRRRGYDVSITAFPSNRWMHNVWAWGVGARRRITHRYPVGTYRTLRFLQTDTVPADPSLHDVEQNLNLLDPLDIELPDTPDLFFHLEDSHREFAEQFLDRHGLNDRHVIGVHPGAGPLDWKRAPEDRFVDEIRRRRTSRSAVLVFGGPDETSLKTRFRTRITRTLDLPAHSVNTSLKHTAALVATCDEFVTNDTALNHIASAMKVPSVVFFCGTNPDRTRPWHDGGEVVQIDPPRSRYPFHATHW